jgi:hypothetical protein
MEAFFQLDVLPAHCTIEAQVGHSYNDVMIRFRAQKRRRWFGTQSSEWSGWYPWTGEPIQLTWKAFWSQPSK